MRVLSLFDGISCARVALDKAPLPVTEYMASEIDNYAISVSKYNYPDIQHIGCVKTVLEEVHGQIDLLIGGFPCQDLSIAKPNRQGLLGERSGLFWDMLRIHKALAPKYFIYENVASMPKQAFAEIDTAIKEVCAEAYAIHIDGALVSAQSRKRIFWTNIPGVGLPTDLGIQLKDVLEDSVEEVYYVDRDKSLCLDANYHKGASYEHYKKKSVRQLVLVGNIANWGQAGRVYDSSGKSRTLAANGGGGGAKTGLYLHADRARKLTPVECERLTTLPDNYTKMGRLEDGSSVKISNTQRYKMLGNAFLPTVIAHILQGIKYENK